LMRLIQEGKVEMQGNPRNMKEFEVRLPGAEGVEVQAVAEQTA
jgi:hypothetical protein